MSRPVAPVQFERRSVVRSRARRRAQALGLSMIGVMGVLAVRGAQLCVEPSERTVEASSITRWGRVTMRAPRGDIVDRNGRRLATTVDSPSVVVDPLLVESDEVGRLSTRLAEILDLDPQWVAERMQRDSRYARLAANVHPEIADEIEALNHPALWIHRDPRRYYPEESLASQVIGFVDASGTGRQGLESSLDEYLRGGVVVVQRRRDRRGYGVDGPVRTPEDAAGLDVHTTIDRVVQRIVEGAVAGVVERHEPSAVSAVVVDVKTGDILALANAPTYNPNALGDDPTPRRNHVVQDAIEPGSVFKPFTVAAAVEAGLVSSDTLIDCESGAWYIGRTRIRDDHPHAVITTSEVVKYSSNIGSAKLALQMGATDFLSVMADFGFGKTTGIPLPGERRGKIRDAERIKPIELATTSYGQGVTSTPLQLVMAVAAIANDGVLMRPRLVTEVVDSDGVPAWQQRPSAVRRVVSAETARSVAEMMVTVTEPGGTATRAQVPGYLIAGKTGTAEKVKDGRYSSERIGSFIGFAPADDPVIAIVVSVDEPSKGSRYGGIVAAPAFAEIAGQTLRHLGIAPNPELLDAEEPTALSALVPVEHESVAVAWVDDAWEVPDLTGRPMRDVLTGLQGTGVALRLEGSGHVVSQTPAPGDLIPTGGALSVVLR